MQKLKFVNSQNQEIMFDNAAPYVFWKISGIETPVAEAIYTQAAGQHGYSLHSILLTQRLVKITGHVHGMLEDGKSSDKYMYELRKKVLAMCSPILGAGTLKYENDAGKWQIPAFCKNIGYGERGRGIQTVELTFECPSPFWLSEQETVISLAYVEGGMNFPLEFPSFFGTLGYRATVTNDGNTLIPIKLTIGGGALNPVVMNTTTNQKIQVNKRFSYSDRLIVNTEPDNISIQLWSVDPLTNTYMPENAFGYLTDDSELFMLAPGENDLLFLSDDQNKMVSIKIEFYKRYVGV